MANAITLDVGGREVRISSPTKELLPGITKEDLAAYVLAIGEPMLDGLRDRPTTMERWPDGVGGESFYAKRLPKGAPAWVQTAEIAFPSGRRATQVAPADLATIVWMVSLNTLRFHAWPVRAADTDAVDELRLDLDPQPGTDFGDARRAALGLREVLADGGLTGWIKTSGGRGLHVYVPVAAVDFLDARHAVIALGRELTRRMPDAVTVNWWKEERGARVFVDYNQMARDRLMASPYSVRAGAQVSMPLAWDDLAGADPGDFTVRTAPGLLAERGDPWATMRQQQPASLDTALEWWQRDLAAGEGELPYPPEYPKMPGEPPRVQPSRAKKPD